MMTPEDVLIEAIQAAYCYGDTPDLRVRMCAKLIKSIQAAGNYLLVPYHDETHSASR